MSVRPVLALVVALVVSAVVSLGGTRPRSTIDLDLIEIDATVVDREGRHVSGLQESDFTVREDGRPVSTATFREVRGPVPGDPDTGRTLVVLLDDAGIPAAATQTMQAIARAFLTNAADFDDVSIVRLHQRNDEPFGDRISNESRIRDYRGGAFPLVYWSTPTQVFGRIAEIARLVAANSSKRKVIVCVGSPYVCNAAEPQPTAPRAFDSSWVDAVRETARANVALYALIPGRGRPRGGGLPDLTGGEVFASSSDVGPSIERILEVAANYYVIGYWSTGQAKRTHTIDVKVARRDVRLRARTIR